MMALNITPPVSQETQNRVKAAALALRQALGDTFSMMECRKAMLICSNDMRSAADWLTDGGWRGGHLSISWNHESLARKTELLMDETGMSQGHCREVLMNCAGNIELARRRLQGLRALAC